MLQIIFHGIGDYFIQTDTWALNKKKKGWFGFRCCFLHCLTYSLPFLFIASWKPVLAIFITHFIIDRTKMIDYLLAIKNNVVKDTYIENFGKWHFPFGINLSKYDISNFGFGLQRPTFISIWLYIITDNLCHIICNYLALKYL